MSDLAEMTWHEMIWFCKRLKGTFSQMSRGWGSYIKMNNILEAAAAKAIREWTASKALVLRQPEEKIWGNRLLATSDIGGKCDQMKSQHMLLRYVLSAEFFFLPTEV